MHKCTDGHLSQQSFVEKYLGTIHFGNDQFSPILGYRDLVQGNITINKVYLLRPKSHHNLISVVNSISDLEFAILEIYVIVRDLQKRRTNRDGENLDKMKEKGDPCILVGYSTQSKGYRVYNKRTRLIVESIHLRFDEIKEMSETSVANATSGLIPQQQKASDYDNSDPVPQLQNVSPSADTSVPSQQELDLLFGPLYDEYFNAGTSRVNKSSSPNDNSAPQDTPPTSKPSTPTIVHAEENNDDQAEFTNPFCTPVQEVAESSSCNIGQCKQDDNLQQILKYEELHQFDKLQVWELVDKPFGKNVIKLKWL
ncbi:retrovirus-related pol polyprotein from transposon TNT 1-94 [Tanacetum coccineum]